MLGDHIGTITGPTSMKAVTAVGGMPTFETTASGLAGTLAGAEVTSFAAVFNSVSECRGFDQADQSV